MKQGNGSDLLGANDPRASTIGIIYVASNDDRDSVLTAILTQEKLGRKQIALVLPSQNKAFQRPVDFDGLKNMRRKLQADLIIVAPQGSSPVEFARQRRFPFYTSLANYTESLQEEKEASRASRRGGWLGLGQKQPAPDNGVEDITPPSNADDFGGRELHDPRAADPNINAAALGLGMGAAGYEAGHLMDAHFDEQDETPVPTSAHYGNEEDEDVRLSPGASPQQGSYRDENEMEAPPTPLHPGAAVNADPEDIDTHPLSPLTDNAGNQPVPLNEPEDDEYDDKGTPSPLPIRRGNTGPRPAVVPIVPVVTPHQGTGGNYAGGTPPPVMVPGGGNTAGRPPRQRRSGWQLLLIALIALVLLSLLLCGGIALAAPGTLGSFSTAMSHIIPGVAPPSATVTITPKTQDLSNQYILKGITSGVPDPTKRQVQARQLTFTSQPASKTVNATGVGHIPASHATGTLTFYNAQPFSQTVGAGTVFTVSGVQIVNNIPAVIPAAHLPTTGFVTVSAHALTTGPSGNISALAINGSCCLTGVAVQNTQAFTGGQSQQDFTDVLQSDIDNAANPLVAQLKPGALSSFDALKHANEQFANTPQCKANVSSDHKAGDRASNVTVKVTITCTGEVYDQSGVQAVAETILKGEAAADITKNDPTANPADYALQENTFTAKVSQATIDKNGNVILQVNAEGIWVYQYTPAKLALLKKLIAGKSSDMAKTLLAGDAGVSLVDSIVLSDNSNTLPTDVNLITIVVKQIPGVQGTPTVTPGTPGAGTPTPVGTLTSPVATPVGTPGK